jgi:hypothetical protein
MRDYRDDCVLSLPELGINVGFQRSFSRIHPFSHGILRVLRPKRHSSNGNPWVHIYIHRKLQCFQPIRSLCFEILL